MAIEAIEGRGVNRANVICDDCGKSEPVTCDYTRQASGSWLPNESQVKKKITAHGWAEVKGKLRCMSCEAKRKVVPMKVKEKEPEQPNEPTRLQKRQIMEMLEDVYDTEAEMYSGGDTDETVADVLGVMPGWVARLREEFFGPDGSNQNLEELLKDMARLDRELKTLLQEAGQYRDKAEKKMAEVSRMRADLEKIKKAVGPRSRKAAGVQ